MDKIRDVQAMDCPFFYSVFFMKQILAERGGQNQSFGYIIK
ncbi:hypothetical protein SAMN05518683_11069 [Salibacterium halotolerans]|uniref:Uncharacterized protein n=1 Tax=Salibacterium halotolerans TaxID=1884432 RepID=A0A1I5T9T1_9BACI|nr:hypothetical protein SAMN05518683_11069 [Salibacterium halotolerans]